MRRPLDGIPAIILCPGPDLPADRLGVFSGHFTVGVNKLWRLRPDYHPTVAFWIDADVSEGCPEWYDRSLCLCDVSAQRHIGHPATGNRPIAIPMRGCKALPRYPQLSPRQLYHRPSAGVVAALWAISLGCWPVVGLGMGCEDDGRPAGQLYAMREARADLLTANYTPNGRWRPALWLWDRDKVDNPVVWASYVNSPRLRNRGPGPESVQTILRQFYR